MALPAVVAGALKAKKALNAVQGAMGQKQTGFSGMLKFAAAIPVTLLLLVSLPFMMFAEEKAQASSGACGSGGASGGAVAGQNDGTPNIHNATIAYHVAKARNVSDRIMLAMMETGLVETSPGFYNWSNPSVPGSDAVQPNDGAAPTGGDHDSVGIMQQRPSASGRDGKRWGTVEQLMDPAYAAGRFLDVAVFVEGQGFSGSAGQLAQRVQVSAHPERYDAREADAIALIEQASGLPAPEGLSVGGVTCSITTVAAGADPTLRDPGPGPQDPQTKNTPRAQNIINLANQNWGCEANPGKQPCVATIGGWRAGSANANSDHPKGRAADIMTNGGGVAANPAEAAMGDEIAAYLQANAVNLGVTYIIWKQQIWNTGDPPNGWTQMEDRGSPTQNHSDHVHVSVAA
jgi:hypothetical protein